MDVNRILDNYVAAHRQLHSAFKLPSPFYDRREFYWYLDGDVCWSEDGKIKEYGSNEFADTVLGDITCVGGLTAIYASDGFGGSSTMIFDNKKRQVELEP